MTTLQVSWGPQHPASGHLRLLLDLDGDIVLKTTLDVGYTHRGIEKLSEKRNYLQNIPNIERVNSYCDACNTVLGYVLAVEESLNLEVPKRAQYIRVVMSEMNRIASHLYWMCLMAISVGHETMLMWTMNDRELLIDLLEMISGARITYSFFMPGGVRRDLPKGFELKTRQTIEYFEKRLDDYWKMLFKNRTFEMRTKGVGVLSSQDAVRLGVVGPVLRGSNLRLDIRKDDPYSNYDEFDFWVPVEKEGDSYARCLIRFYEMKESISIIKQALARLPEGAIFKKAPSTLPYGEVYSRVEATRGELGYYLVSNGTDKPYRLKISTPSFRNMLVLPYLISDVTMADVPVIYISLDLIPPDIDR